MSRSDRALLREAIRRTLAVRAGDAPDANAIAEVGLSTWREVAGRLTPMIGARGFDALFSRSLHLTSAAFPWLATDGDHKADDALFASLKARLAARDADAAAEASYTLLTTFTELLATLIGVSLTELLLSPVWASKLSASKQEKVS